MFGGGKEMGEGRERWEVGRRGKEVVGDGEDYGREKEVVGGERRGKEEVEGQGRRKQDKGREVERSKIRRETEMR